MVTISSKDTPTTPDLYLGGEDRGCDSVENEDAADLEVMLLLLLLLLLNMLSHRSRLGSVSLLLDFRNKILLRGIVRLCLDNAISRLAVVP